MTSQAYRVDDETIVKVDTKTNGSLEELEHERDMAQQALIAGVPTAIAFDIVQVSDVDGGHEAYGLLFELMRADTLTHALMSVETLAEVAELGAKWGRLARELHAAEADPTKIPSTKDVYIATMR